MTSSKFILMGLNIFEKSVGTANHSFLFFFFYYNEHSVLTKFSLHFFMTVRMHYLNYSSLFNFFGLL